jgi:cytochrome c oxidase cbb3-type subunit 3
MGGLVGPNLTDEYWIHGCSIDEIITNITTGFPDMGMLPYGSTKKLTDEQLVQVASYIISKKGSNPAEPKEIDPAREVLCPPAGGAPTASK